MLALLAWALLAAGIGLESGQFHPLALALVLAAEVVLVVLVVRGGERRPLRGRDLLAPGLVVALAVVAWRPVWYASGPLLPVAHALAGVAVLAAAWAVLSAAASGAGPRPRWALPARLHWGLPAALAAAATVAMVRAAPRPAIDVWVFGQQASAGLLDGRNPYTTTWVDSPGLQAVYPYLPGTAVLLGPARWLLGDVRHGLLVALLLASWAARRLALRRLALRRPALRRPGLRRAAPDRLAGWDGPAAAAVAVPLLLLLVPRWTWSVAQAWTEPLLLAALAGTAWAVETGRRRAAVALVALALASKQHVALLLPVLWAWRAFGPRRTVVAAALAGLLVLPWLAVGPAAFWHDVVVANLALEPRLRSLGLASLARRLDVPWGFPVVLALLAAALLLALRRLPGTAHGSLLGGALVLLTLDLANRQTYFNHYTLPLGLLTLAALTAPRDAGQAPDAAPHRASSAPAVGAAPSGPGRGGAPLDR